MSHSAKIHQFRGARLAPLAAPLVVTALLSACSTDVQRFGHTGSIATSNSVAGAPVEPVERQPLGLASGPTRVSAGSAYANGVTTAAAVATAPDRSYSGASAAASSVRVAPGDTVFSIAQRHGVGVERLAAANGLAYPYAIDIGQELILPGAAGSGTPAPATRVAAAAGATSHTVAPGDTLFNISKRYGVDVASLADANSLDDNATIRIGQTLRLPSGASGGTSLGGPLQLASRSVERDAGAADGARVLKSRAVEAGEDAAAEAPGAVIEANAADGEPDGAGVLSASEETGKFRWPARGRIIARYGVGADGQRNDGINISVPEGASVKAAENGVVAYAGDELKGYGNLILLRHANDWVTAYAHNSSLLVKRGDTVKRGQIIAKAGQSGSVDKPQLHFEIRQGSKAVDPMPYLEGA